MSLLALLVGCGAPTANKNDSEMVVDCDRMDFTLPLSAVSRTQLWAQDESGALERRCTLSTSPTLFVDDVPFVAGEDAIELFSGSSQNLANLIVIAFGSKWVSDGGTLHIESRDGGVVSGTYEAQGFRLDPVTGEASGDRNEWSGSFGWCDRSSNPACPGAADVGQLSQAYTMKTPFYDTAWEGMLTTCRMAHDAAGQGLQVDVEIGTIRGESVGQLWFDACSAGGVNPPRANYLRFRAGGVPSSGGTFEAVVADTPSGRLPGVEFTYPMTFYPDLSAGLACALYPWTGTVYTPPGGSCSYTVDPVAGHFSFVCDVDQFSPASLPITADATGEMRFDADCDWVEL